MKLKGRSFDALEEIQRPSQTQIQLDSCNENSRGGGQEDDLERDNRIYKAPIIRTLEFNFALFKRPKIKTLLAR